MYPKFYESPLKNNTYIFFKIYTAYGHFERYRLCHFIRDPTDPPCEISNQNRK